MFDSISSSYDRLNRILSGFQDVRWRKQAVGMLQHYKNKKPVVMDLASGSGDLGKEFLKLQPQLLYSVDISEEMLKICRKKINSEINKVILAESTDLPFENEHLDICGVSFGIRNFCNLDDSINEIRRVLKAGGAFLTIEFFKTENVNMKHKLFNFYFRKIIPFVGNKLSGSTYAYNYLFDSINEFMTVNEYRELLQQNGFSFKRIKNNFLDFVYTVYAEKNNFAC